MARECSSRSKLATLAQGLCQEEERRVTCMKRLDAVHAKAETRQGRLYMEASFANGSRWGLLDMRPDTNYLTEEVARSLGVKWTPSKGRFKGVNGEWMGLLGEARNVPLKIGNWSGKANFSVPPMDDYGLVFGMELLDQVKPIIVPSKDTMVILQGEKPCVVKFRRENEN
ncbi:OLC1v1012922C1 [Oldenlandia corymbosa var. corymbosa]|uniref:OLC1v1012922C1 n=1 Tax=Oldenlandia corymbosa var. corymbosa TaxID=529605 RepID=A0AAV1E0M8_OLDCO|nr:OLC1v1012922C1 [Oldenlandia corymbosa var. corymbosa]